MSEFVKDEEEILDMATSNSTGVSPSQQAVLDEINTTNAQAEAFEGAMVVAENKHQPVMGARTQEISDAKELSQV
jgi:hypothetical protein